MTEPSQIKKQKPLAKSTNINGEQIIITPKRNGFFTVQKENETLFASPRLKDAEVFFINCF